MLRHHYITHKMPNHKSPIRVANCVHTTTNELILGRKKIKVASKGQKVKYSDSITTEGDKQR